MKTVKNKSQKIRIIIGIVGGNVTTVFCSHEADVDVLDWDNLEREYAEKDYETTKQQYERLDRECEMLKLVF